MAQQAAIRKIVDRETSGEFKPPGFGGGEPPGPPVALAGPIVSNGRLAILMFIVAEAMFFSGLIGAFIVFKLAAEIWPPPFQPRLPVAVTGVNTVILLVSGIAMQLAVRAARQGKSAPLMRWLGSAAVLGAVFLVIQGYEWVRLIHYGLRLSSGVYGSTFYTLIGCHGAHVLGAVCWLLVVLSQASKGRFSAHNYQGVQLSAMYWTFVVALWPLLYGLVYL